MYSGNANNSEWWIRGNVHHNHAHKYQRRMTVDQVTYCNSERFIRRFEFAGEIHQPNIRFVYTVKLGKYLTHIAPTELCVRSLLFCVVDVSLAFISFSLQQLSLYLRFVVIGITLVSSVIECAVHVHKRRIIFDIRPSILIIGIAKLRVYVV